MKNQKQMNSKSLTQCCNLSSFQRLHLLRIFKTIGILELCIEDIEVGVEEDNLLEQEFPFSTF